MNVDPLRVKPHIAYRLSAVALMFVVALGALPKGDGSAKSALAAPRVRWTTSLHCLVGR